MHYSVIKGIFLRTCIVCAFLLTFFIIHLQWGLGINTTESVDHHFFLLKKKAVSKIYDYIVFKKTSQGVLPDNTLFIKKVMGSAGDEITHDKNKLFVNGVYLGDIKTKSKEGQPLSAGFVGVIPSNYFFVGTIHPDSFDSRYAQMGLIHESEIIAVAYPFW